MPSISAVSLQHYSQSMLYILILVFGPHGNPELLLCNLNRSVLRCHVYKTIILDYISINPSEVFACHMSHLYSSSAVKYSIIIP